MTLARLSCGSDSWAVFLSQMFLLLQKKTSLLYIDMNSWIGSIRYTVWQYEFVFH